MGIKQDQGRVRTPEELERRFEFDRRISENEKQVAKISLKADRIDAIIDFDGQIRAGVIIEAINGTASTVKILADRIDMQGVVTFLSDSKDMTRIIGGVIDTEYISSKLAKIGGWDIIENGIVKRVDGKSGTGMSAYIMPDGADPSNNYSMKESLLPSGGYSPIRFFAGAPLIGDNGVKPNEASFTVLEDGSVYSAAFDISGGKIGSWILKDGVLRSSVGVLGRYKIPKVTPETDTLTYTEETGYMFVELRANGLFAVIKESSEYSSNTQSSFSLASAYGPYNAEGGSQKEII